MYLDLAADLIGQKTVIRSPLGEERQRVDKALQLAGEGREVALVCSGDPGIYALATLALERLEQISDRAIAGVGVNIVPGISAFQAAAARLGAPMGHDFCLISLSDLLTPEATIRRRLQAAAEGDFVTAFYNPQSRKRQNLLAEALDIFRRYRSDETPVAVCRQIDRPEESITVCRLAELDLMSVDMLTLVIIGNRESRCFDKAGRQWLFTPRGYGENQ